VFSVLSELNTPDRNITTMEDPVEYELEGVNQAEIDTHRNVTWEPLLKGFLRQDPDAGLIGEIRDRATAETAIRQALTGHVVFATLHTISCAQTVERLIDMGVNADMLASALTLVASQRLVRCLCPQCRVRASADVRDRELFESHGFKAPAELWHPRAAGCPECRQGYKGRRAAVEILPIAEDVARLIEGRARARDFAEWARGNGFPTVYEVALGMAAEGITSMAEACEWQSVWEDFSWKE
jgi:type IV pilus assembly protein PilB